MTGKFFVITINYRSGVKNAAIEKVLVAFDWLRFSANSYYVYSYLGAANDIYNIVKPIVGATDDILVVEVTIANRQGWASKTAVDWLQKPRA